VHTRLEVNEYLVKAKLTPKRWVVSDLAANLGSSPATKPTKPAALGFRLEVMTSHI